MNYQTIEFEVREGVGYLTLNRPDAANALDMQMAEELMDLAVRCTQDPAIRTVLLRGKGRMFCGGGDLKAFLKQDEQLPVFLKRITTYAHVAFANFARMDAPLVAAVQGSAAGGGLAMVLASDLVIAADNARFTMAYTKAGLVPDCGSSYYLPRVVGLKRAMELTLTNRIFSAAEALQMGLVSRVVPEAELDSAAVKLAQELADGPVHAFGTAKRLLRDGWNRTLESQMELESIGMADTARGRESREGIAAFSEKRPPRFRQA